MSFRFVAFSIHVAEHHVRYQQTICVQKSHARSRDDVTFVWVSQQHGSRKSACVRWKGRAGICDSLSFESKELG